jgi:hypothetical protein
MALLRPAMVQLAPRRITRPHHPAAIVRVAALTAAAAAVDTTVVAAVIADRNGFRQG